MALQPNDTKLVKDSWALVNGDLPAVGMLFYKNLFEAAPAARELFAGTTIEKQSLRLMEMVDAAVKLLDQPEVLVPVLKELGERHGAYGTEEVHYPIVGGALMKTLSMGLGKNMTPEVEAAWGRVYGLISSTMIEGSNTPAGKELSAKYKAKQALKKSGSCAGACGTPCCYLTMAAVVLSVAGIAYLVTRK